MKIELSYDRPSQIRTDLLVVILDSQTRFHDLAGSPVDEVVRRVAGDLKAKRLKTEYFTSLNSRGTARNLIARPWWRRRSPNFVKHSPIA